MNDPLVLEALRPWDGRWYYPLPEPAIRRVSITQHTALQILAGREGLTVADAKLLQAIAIQEGPLTGTQRFRLDRLAKAHDERLAA